MQENLQDIKIKPKVITSKKAKDYLKFVWKFFEENEYDGDDIIYENLVYLESSIDKLEKKYTEKKTNTFFV